MVDFPHTLMLGQSLPAGSGGSPSLSTVSEVSNAYIVANDGTTANTLKNSTTQQPYLTLGYRVAATNPAILFGFSTHALSGQTIAQLSKGGSSTRYEQALGAISGAFTRQTTTGKTYVVRAMHWMQGEADQTFSTPRATYRAAFEALRASYAADILAATGQATTIPWILSQTATWAHYGNAASIGLELLQIAREIPGVYIVGGQYQFPYADGLHMTNVGYYKNGELQGRAHNAILAGQPWKPFAPKSITATVGGLTVQYDMPTSPLVFDTTLIAAQPNYGFSLSGTSALITGVSLTAADTVTITTNKPITETGAKLGYGVSANNGSVGLGNLRDSDPSVSVYDGQPIPNWALHSNDELTPYPSSPGKIYSILQKYWLDATGRTYVVTPGR